MRIHENIFTPTESASWGMGIGFAELRFHVTIKKNIDT
jgi:hypothetical protein